MYTDDCECVLWVGIAVSVCNNLVWPREIGGKESNQHQTKPSSLSVSLNLCFFPSGPESRERPGVLRVQCQAPHTAPSACEQTRNPSHSPIFFFLSFIPLSIPPNPTLLSPPLHSSPQLLAQEVGGTLPRQTEDRIGVHHGSSDRQTAG